MRNSFGSKTIVAGFALAAGLLPLDYPVSARAQQAGPAASADAITAAQTQAPVQPTRPEQQKTPQDQSDKFSAAQAVPSSPAFGKSFVQLMRRDSVPVGSAICGPSSLAAQIVRALIDSRLSLSESLITKCSFL